MKSRCPALDPMHSSVIFIELHPSSSNLIQLQQHWGVAPLLCLAVSCVFPKITAPALLTCAKREQPIVWCFLFLRSIHSSISTKPHSLTHSLLPLPLPLPSSPLSFCSSLVVYGHYSRSNFPFIHFLHSFFHSIYLISPLHSRLHESPPPHFLHSNFTKRPQLWSSGISADSSLLICSYSPFLLPSLLLALSHTHTRRIYRRDASRSTMDPRLVLGWDHDRICFCWSIPLEQVTTKHKYKNKT